jgi:hypothetical protein
MASEPMKHLLGSSQWQSFYPSHVNEMEFFEAAYERRK